MTRKHAKEMLPIIAAYAEGETIQITDKWEDNWKDSEDPAFDSAPYMRYRIKPDPDPDPYAELKAAHAAGKVIQFNYGTAESPRWKDCSYPIWESSPEDYRTKPTPKLVPMTSDDLPPVVWVRMAQNPMELVIGVTEQGHLITRSTRATPQYLHEDGYTWSPDRKTWHSFMKEETQP